MYKRNERKISKFVLVGKPKNILARVKLKRKLKENSLKRVTTTTNKKLFENINQLNNKKSEKEFFENLAKKRRREAAKLRKPGMKQKMSRAIHRSRK